MRDADTAIDATIDLVETIKTGISYAGKDGNEEPSHLIITGDSQEEQKAYFKWVMKTALTLGLPRERLSEAEGYEKMSIAVAFINSKREEITYGAGAGHRLATEQKLPKKLPEDTIFFSIYGDTSYDAGSHRKLLDAVGYTFGESFNFTESDCHAPQLMALHRGNLAEVFDRPYEQGVKEYTDYVFPLMQRKEIPQDLIDRQKARYKDDASIQNERKKAERYAAEYYRFTPEHLKCMEYAPL